jgi:RNA polymerase sigma-70 factor (ECF subfamily)
MPDRPSDDPTSLAGRLYDSYGASLYRYALMLLADRAAAEDAVQQVFASLLKGSARAIEPRAIEKDAHYLRRAVRNECYSTLRRKSVRDAHGGDLLEGMVGTDAHPEERLAVESALRSLSPEQREVVHLHVYEGLTFQEIADAAGESINTIASRYRYALAKLRQTLT